MNSTKDTTPAARDNKWLALAAVVMAFTFTFISRFIWTAAAAEPVAQLFSLNATQTGLYMSAFFAGYLITQIPGGIMADRFQPKYILIVCTLLGGVATALMATIQSYEMGLVFRVITGISGGCIMSSCSKVVAVKFPIRQRATAMGILLASPPIGISIANAVGPMLNTAFGWRGAFIATALLSVLVAVCIFLFVSKLPQAAPAAGGNAKPGMLEGLKIYFTNKQQLLLGVGGFMFMFVNVGFSTWAVKFALSLELTGAQGGMVVTIYSLAGIVGSCFSGAIAQKLKLNHKSFLIVSLTAMGVMTLVFSLQSSYIGLIIAGIVYGFSAYLPSTHFTTLAMKYGGERYSATAVSTQNLIFQTASLIMPVIIGSIIDATGNYSFVWYTFAGIMAISVVFTLLTQKD